MTGFGEASPDKERAEVDNRFMKCSQIIDGMSRQLPGFNGTHDLVLFGKIDEHPLAEQPAEVNRAQQVLDRLFTSFGTERRYGYADSEGDGKVLYWKIPAHSGRHDTYVTEFHLANAEPPNEVRFIQAWVGIVPPEEYTALRDIYKEGHFREDANGDYVVRERKPREARLKRVAKHIRSLFR